MDSRFLPVVDERSQVDTKLTGLLADVWGDPEAYAELVFPWGQKGTMLEDSELKTWQRSYLRELGEEIRSRGFDGKTPVEPIHDSTVSGHGIGKSALTAIVTKFLHDTIPHSRGVVTANTSTQLRIRTWAEVGKWHRMSLTRNRSEYFASRGNMALVHKNHPESWRVDAFTCSKENSEAFQGQHARSASSFYVFDEASAIPKPIWEAAMGGMTDGLPIWLCFGNGTRNSGEFYESHNSKRTMWRHRSIDSREVEDANAKLFARWLELYGEDSDFYRVRVKGEFPHAASLQFIPTDVVEWCMHDVQYKFNRDDPLIYGVDVARFGDDESVLCRRRGRHVFPIEDRFPKLDVITYAQFIADKAKEEHPDAIFIDGSGVGGGVVDMLNKLGVRNVIEINGASKATGKECANMRAQCWHNARKALALGVDLPDDDDLKTDLIALEYGYRISDNKILLERKEDAKRRGIASPDLGDAFTLTYALPVAMRSESSRNHVTGQSQATRPTNMVTDHEE